LLSGATQHPCSAFFLGVVAKPRHGEPGHLERRQSRRLWDSLEDGNSRWDDEYLDAAKQMFDKPGEYARILNLKAKPAKKKKGKQ